MLHTTKIIVVLSSDPVLAQIGWAAAHRGDLLLVAVSTALPWWRRKLAPLQAWVTKGHRAPPAPGVDLAPAA